MEGKFIMNSTAPETTPQWPTVFAKSISAFAIMVGAFVLLGWVIYLWLPIELARIIISVKPNAAFCFILSGMALWLRCENNKIYTQYLAQICAAAIFLLAFLTLFEFFFHINIGIDQGIFKEHERVGFLLPPGRMSPFSATNFVLIGFVLFFMNNNIISYRNHQILMTIVFFFTLYTLLGYVYHLGNSFTIFADNPILPPLICIITFILLSLGIFFARPQDGVVSIARP
jgi:heme A synthase